MSEPKPQFTPGKRAAKELAAGGWTLCGRANMRRIAEIIDQETAAPDLYAALYSFVRIADSQDKPSIANQGQAMDGYSLLANLMGCIPAARAALSKARGE